MNQKTLLLNASYAPLAVVPLRRAVILILAEKAEVVDEDSSQLHSERFSMPIPKVIRLLKFVRVPFVRRVPVTRRAVLQRDGHVCSYCHGKADTMDHVRPKFLGGKHTWTNVVAACRSCNGKKGRKTLEEMGWSLGFKPFEPAGTVALCVVIGVLDEAWQPYLV